MYIRGDAVFAEDYPTFSEPICCALKCHVMSGRIFIQGDAAFAENCATVAELIPCALKCHSSFQQKSSFRVTSHVRCIGDVRLRMMSDWHYYLRI